MKKSYELLTVFFIDPNILNSISSQANLDYILDQSPEPVMVEHEGFDNIDAELLMTNESNEYEIEEYPIFSNEFDEKSIGVSLVMNTESKCVICKVLN